MRTDDLLFWFSVALAERLMTIKTMKTSSCLLCLPFHNRAMVLCQRQVAMASLPLLHPHCHQHCAGVFVCQITTLFAVIASIALALSPALRCVVALILLPSLPSLRWRPCPCHTSVTTSITLASLPYSQWCLPNCNVTRDMLLYVMSSSCSLSSCVALLSYPTSS